MPPPEARIRRKSSKYASTARTSLEVLSAMALRLFWNWECGGIVPAGADVCKIARMSLPVILA